MNVLIVFAHPEPRSLNGALNRVAVEALLEAGHDVRVSDLYASGWKSEVDRADFTALASDTRLQPTHASKEAFSNGTQSPDIAAEQEKLRWANALILQFPLWWFTMPAILKGWVERVFAYGFGYGVGEHSETRWGDRYGDGALAGKRALLLVTAGGWAEHYSDRGVNGPIDDLLFPIHHGILFYAGMSALPPFLLYRADSVTPERFDVAAAALRARMASLFTEPPIPFRTQNGGDYVLPSLRLRSDIEPEDVRGFALHRRVSS